MKHVFPSHRGSALKITGFLSLTEEFQTPWRDPPGSRFVLSYECATKDPRNAPSISDVHIELTLKVLLVILCANK
jgi:hypothetical protein